MYTFQDQTYIYTAPNGKKYNQPIEVDYEIDGDSMDYDYGSISGVCDYINIEIDKIYFATHSGDFKEVPPSVFKQIEDSVINTIEKQI